MLYIETESRFMQRAKSCIGNSLAKKPKNDVFSSLSRKVYQITMTKQSKSNNYEWAKQTKFLLAVINGSPRRHWNSLNPLKKIEKIEINLYDHFRTSWSFKTMNRLGSTRPDPTVTFLTVYFLNSIKDRVIQFWQNIHSSF